MEETVIEESPKSEDETMGLLTSPDSIQPETRVQAVSAVRSEAVPRINRSHSSSCVLQPQPHAVRNAFLSPPKPSSIDRSILAMPLPLCQPEARAEAKKSSGWSDSEDEGPVKAKRAVKKMKADRPKARITIPMAEMMRTEQILLGGGLRSPFQEKAELQF